MKRQKRKEVFCSSLDLGVYKSKIQTDPEVSRLSMIRKPQGSALRL